MVTDKYGQFMCGAMLNPNLMEGTTWLPLKINCNSQNVYRLCAFSMQYSNGIFKVMELYEVQKRVTTSLNWTENKCAESHVCLCMYYNI